MFDTFLLKSGRRIISLLLVLSLAFSPALSYAQSTFVSTLPEPGKMVNVSSAFAPILVKGLVIHPDKPLNFDFIVDSGNDSAEQAIVQAQSEKIVRYFLAALTVPEEQLWVNLSPYEKDRIIDEGLGQTVLGRDMLAQDYVLKQLTASLIYPEDNLGKDFWGRIYKEAQDKFGTTDIPVDTFNKVWIVPQKAVVFEKDNAVYVTEARLKVMLDSDYVAARHVERSETSPVSLGLANEVSQNNSGDPSPSAQDDVKSLIRQIILPAIEKEVNEGKNFSTLRQIYYAAILAKWYRELIQDTLMSKAYVGQNKISGVNSDDKTLKEQIYQRYISAYKQGVFNYIKDETDVVTGETTPRKYFSGGLDKFGDIKLDKAQNADGVLKVGKVFKVDFAMGKTSDAAMFVLAKAKIAFWQKTGNVNQIANMLSDENDKIQQAAQVALTKLAINSDLQYQIGFEGTERYQSESVMIWAIDMLLESAKSGDNQRVIDAIMTEMQTDYYRPAVLWDLHPGVRRAAHEALEKLKVDKEILFQAYLSKAKEHSNFLAATIDAIKWLGDFGDKRAVGVIADQLRYTPWGGLDQYEQANQSYAWQAAADALVKLGVDPKIVSSGLAITRRYSEEASYVRVSNYPSKYMTPSETAMAWAAFDRETSMDWHKWDKAQDETSSALSENVDPAMVNEVVQWVQSNLGWTIAGVVVSLTAALVMARNWWLKNTIAGRKVFADRLASQQRVEKEKEVIAEKIRSKLPEGYRDAYIGTADYQLAREMLRNYGDFDAVYLINNTPYYYRPDQGLWEPDGYGTNFEFSVVKPGAGGNVEAVMLQDTSSALSANVPDASMANEFQQWGLNHPVWAGIFVIGWGFLSTSIIKYSFIVQCRRLLRQHTVDENLFYYKHYSLFVQKMYVDTWLAEFARSLKKPLGQWTLVREQAGQLLFKAGMADEMMRERISKLLERKYDREVANMLAGRIEKYNPGQGDFFSQGMKNSSDSAENGGIDIQNIDVNKSGNAKIKFNDDALKQILSGGFDGFTPVFIKMTPVENPLMILGVAEPALAGAKV